MIIKSVKNMPNELSVCGSTYSDPVMQFKKLCAVRDFLASTSFVDKRTKKEYICDYFNGYEAEINWLDKEVQEHQDVDFDYNIKMCSNWLCNLVYNKYLSIDTCSHRLTIGGIDIRNEPYEINDNFVIIAFPLNSFMSGNIKDVKQAINTDKSFNKKIIDNLSVFTLNDFKKYFITKKEYDKLKITPLSQNASNEEIIEKINQIIKVLYS